VNQTLYSKLPFDPEKDFAPVALFATAPIVLIVNPGVPANGVQELIALAKKEPGKLNFASAGNGTTNHLSGELFKSMANIDIVHVPYRGISAVQLSPIKSSGVGYTLDAAENTSIFVQYVPARSSPVAGTTTGQRHGTPPKIIDPRTPRQPPQVAGAAKAALLHRHRARHCIGLSARQGPQRMGRPRRRWSRRQLAQEPTRHPRRPRGRQRRERPDVLAGARRGAEIGARHRRERPPRHRGRSARRL